MTDSSETAIAPDEWAIVEMMGHRQLAGRVSEVMRYGASLMRLDVPAGDDFVTKLIGGASIYCATSCTEEVARGFMARMPDPRPMSPAAYRASPVLTHRDDTLDEEPY